MSVTIDTFFATHQDRQEALLGTTVMVVSGQSIPVVWDSVTRSKSGTIGGLESNTLATASCQPKNVANPQSLIGKRCTVDGLTYRVHEIDIGAVNITFTLIDVSSSS